MPKRIQLINTTKDNLPKAEVTQMILPNGKVSDSIYGVFPEGRSYDGIEPFNTVSSRYNVAQHSQIVERIDDILQQEYDYTRSLEISEDGAKLFGHYQFNSLDTEISTGDTVGLRMMLMNSYDCSSGIILRLLGNREMCSNILLTRHKVMLLKIRHTSDIPKFMENVVPDFTEEMVDNFGSTVQLWRKWNNTLLTEQSQEHILTQLQSMFPKKIFTAIKDAEMKTVWEMFNSVTYQLTHSMTSLVASRYFNKVCSIFEGIK